MTRLESFSIEWLEEDPGPCVVCREPAGQGPVAWRKRPDPGPVCDGCMLRQHPGLGLVLFIVGAQRELGRFSERLADDPEALYQLMIKLIALAEEYDRSAARLWSHRPECYLLRMDQALANATRPRSQRVQQAAISNRLQKRVCLIDQRIVLRIITGLERDTGRVE